MQALPLRSANCIFIQKEKRNIAAVMIWKTKILLAMIAAATAVTAHEDINDIPAEKAEESVIITDACACGCSEEEILDKVEDTVESDEI